MIRSSLLIVVIAMLTLASCNGDARSSPMDIPGVLVKDENWNTSFKLIDDPVLSNSHKNGDILTLRAENLSSSAIVFPDNYNLFIVRKDEENWVSVQNNSYNAGSDYLPTKDSWPLGLAMTALPYIPDLSSPTEIRVYAIGHAEDNDRELLGAYIDVALEPWPTP